MIRFSNFWILVPLIAGCAPEAAYQATDFTGEQLFSRNIEGPAWKDGYLYVVNFGRDGTIGRVDENGHAELFANLPEGSTANSIRFNREGDMLMADFTGHNILKLDMGTRAVTVFAHDSLFSQPNDIAINAAGQVFASDPGWERGTGRIWRIDPDGSTHILADSLGTANGITFSPDEKTLYVSESDQRMVWAYRVDENGMLQEKRKFKEFPDFKLDGMKCDNTGNLYITRYDKGAVVIYTPDGVLIGEVLMRGKKVSNITFGGPDGKTCFVTLQDRGCIETFRSEFSGIQ